MVVGKISSLNTKERRNFECYRNELRGIEVICFDELLDKINTMISLLENNIDDLNNECENEDDDLPF